MPHKFKMPQEYIDRMQEKLGREHVQETFNPKTTALVVVDMQNYFMDENQMAGCPVGQTIVDNVNTIAQTVRKNGGIVIWVQNMAPDHTAETWKTAHERYSQEKAQIRIKSMQPGASETITGLPIDKDSITDLGKPSL